MKNIVKKFNVDNSQDTKFIYNFQQKLPQQLPLSIEDHWNQMKNAIISSCKDTIGFKTKTNQNWFDKND